MVGFIQISLKQLILIFIFFVQEFKYGVYSFDWYPPPPDSTLSIAGKAADSKVVGDKLSTLNNSINGINDSLSEFHTKQIGSSDGPTYTFKISTTENTSAQYYRTYFLLILIGQNAQLMQATITWRGPSGDLSQEIQHGSGASISHSNGTVTVKFPYGTWGRLYVCWWNNSITVN